MSNGIRVALWKLHEIKCLKYLCCSKYILNLVPNFLGILKWMCFIIKTWRGQIKPWNWMVGGLAYHLSLFFLRDFHSRVQTGLPEWSWSQRWWSPSSPPLVHQWNTGFLAFPVFTCLTAHLFYSHSWSGFQTNKRNSMYSMYINSLLSKTLVASLLWFNSDCKKWRINYSWVAKRYALLIYDFTFRFQRVTFFALSLTNIFGKTCKLGGADFQSHFHASLSPNFILKSQFLYIRRMYTHT